MREGCSAHTDRTHDFTNSPHLVHIPPLYIFLLKKMFVILKLLILVDTVMFVFLMYLFVCALEIRGSIYKAFYNIPVKDM